MSTLCDDWFQLCILIHISVDECMIKKRDGSSVHLYVFSTFAFNAFSVKRCSEYELNDTPRQVLTLLFISIVNLEWEAREAICVQA